MRLSAWRSLAVVSFTLLTAASAATRPQYGGTLRVVTRIAPVSLDPADGTLPDSPARRNLIVLLFDTLVMTDDAGQIQPGLATSWQAESSYQRWQFWIRTGVDFQDGSLLRADAVAASLRVTHSAWTIYPTGNSIVIECGTPEPNLPAELALSRNAIAKRTPAGTIFGTGPFRLAEWQPGKKLVLTAQEGYWGGRPFLDSIVIELGRSFRDQTIALDVGKTDLGEIPVEQVRRLAMQSRRIVTSAAVELMALVFVRDSQTPEERRLREALSLGIDRAAIRNVVLQGEGEIAGGILPNWMGGYEFVFPAAFGLPRAQQIRGELRQTSTWSLGYDAADPVSRLVAERIALNARDVGMTLQPSASAVTDIRLMHVLLPSMDSRIALTSAATSMGMPAPKFASDSVEDLYQAESTMLQSRRLIPLLHLPAVAYTVGPAVRSFAVDRDGGWHLPDVWLAGTDRP
jgi:peptide/nickel transport system substrate-binding protein